MRHINRNVMPYALTCNTGTEWVTVINGTLERHKWALGVYETLVGRVLAARKQRAREVREARLARADRKIVARAE